MCVCGVSEWKQGRMATLKRPDEISSIRSLWLFFYSVTCHQGSCCLLGVSQAGLLTHSTFNITDWIVQGVTIDSDTARWKGTSLHILPTTPPPYPLRPPSVAGFFCRGRCNRFQKTVKSMGVRGSPRERVESSASDFLFFFFLTTEQRHCGCKSSFRFPSSLSMSWPECGKPQTCIGFPLIQKEQWLRGFQATWTLMTQGPLAVNRDQVSVRHNIPGTGGSF